MILAKPPMLLMRNRSRYSLNTSDLIFEIGAVPIQVYEFTELHPNREITSLRLIDQTRQRSLRLYDYRRQSYFAPSLAFLLLTPLRV